MWEEVGEIKYLIIGVEWPNPSQTQIWMDLNNYFNV